MFKSYSPLPASPPGRAGKEVEGGKALNDRTISEGAERAAAVRQPEANTFNDSP